MILALYEGNNIWGLGLLMVPTISFFITNLEEYYTHKMYLPMINPAVEGVVITGFVIGLVAVFG